MGQKESGHAPARRAVPGVVGRRRFRNFSRERVRVLMSLDVSTVDLNRKEVRRTDRDFAVTWAGNYGNGRVFYSSLGHPEAAWDGPDIQKMWIEGISWALGMDPGDATPRPKQSD